MNYNFDDPAVLDADFYEGLRLYSSYKILEKSSNKTHLMTEDMLSQYAVRMEESREQMEMSFLVLDGLSQEKMDEQFENATLSNRMLTFIFDRPENDELRMVGMISYPLSDIARWWREDYYARSKARKPDKPPRHIAAHTDVLAVHSSMPVYDIGETIARGVFVHPAENEFPTAAIIGDTEGRLELMPFWNTELNEPISPQDIVMMRNVDTKAFARLREQAIDIATSFNEEMATYFYAMDAYWLNHAKDADDYVVLQIEDLMQYTGKKPVKNKQRYTTTFRPDQIQRAGMMAYGLGHTMVEIDRATVRGKGVRTHYTRLWDVADAFIMRTLDGERYIESIRFRPNEIFRAASFGRRRETALLMSRVLALDYSKMVYARRLGRYYTWLWRDRAYRGSMSAPVSCEKLLMRSGIEVKPEHTSNARRALETALDRLEQEGIIAQWILLDERNDPVDNNKSIPFTRWLGMKIMTSPPDSIFSHYSSRVSKSVDIYPFEIDTAADAPAPEQLELPLPSPPHAASPAIGSSRPQGSSRAPSDPAAYTVKSAKRASESRSKRTRGIPHLDIALLNRLLSERGTTIQQVSKQIGVSPSTLSRILSGKTTKPHQNVKNAILQWIEG